jgi:hypothetical protein
MPDWPSTSTPIEAPAWATFPVFSIAPPTTPPTLPPTLPILEDCHRFAVSASAPFSEVVRPSEAVSLAAPDPAAAPPAPAPLPFNRPETPPLAFIVDRNEAPEAVPGSTKASSRNSTIGMKQATSMMIDPTTDMPMFSEVEAKCSGLSPMPFSSPSGMPAHANCVPIPTTSASSGSISTHAKNQRIDFHIHDFVPSDSAPAAAIGMVATRISSAAERTIMITMCPKAAGIRMNREQIPSVAAWTVPLTWSTKSSPAA